MSSGTIVARMDPQQAVEKLQRAVDEMMESLQRDKVRPLQREAHLKIANCYGNSKASTREVEGCANSAFGPLQHIQGIVQQEMNHFQDRFGRCATDCQEQTRDNFGAGGDDEGAERFMNKCVLTCVDKHIALLKSVQNNIKRDIDQVTK